jgi:hypothetical protein
MTRLTVRHLVYSENAPETLCGTRGPNAPRLSLTLDTYRDRPDDPGAGWRYCGRCTRHLRARNAAAFPRRAS